MGNKSVLKKQYIVEKAAKVFAEKGFKAVTMKDIVEACDISRGGLYLYFKDTKEIFEAVLAKRENAGLAVLKEATKDDASGDVLLTYLNEKKKDIIRKKDNLEGAAFEYAFTMKAEKKDSLLKKQYQEETKALEKLIADGVKKKWMVCDNPQAAAKNIICTLEGLKVTTQAYGLSADAFDQAIEYMLGSVGLTAK